MKIGGWSSSLRSWPLWTQFSFHVGRRGGGRVDVIFSLSLHSCPLLPSTGATCKHTPHLHQLQHPVQFAGGHPNPTLSSTASLSSHPSALLSHLTRSHKATQSVWSRPFLVPSSLPVARPPGLWCAPRAAWLRPALTTTCSHDLL